MRKHAHVILWLVRYLDLVKCASLDIWIQVYSQLKNSIKDRLAGKILQEHCNAKARGRYYN